MLNVKVDQLFLSNMGFVVILRSEEDERAVPIFIGAAEAQAIAIQIQEVKVPRPLTHDLLKNVLDYLECRLKRVEICDIRENTYYGQLIVEWNGEDKEIDCRPSDAIALSLRATSPIYVHEKVMEEAGRILDHIEPDEEAAEMDSKADSEEEAPKSPLEILKVKLEKAIEDERYEDAALLRDEINNIEKNATN